MIMYNKRSPWLLVDWKLNIYIPVFFIGACKKMRHLVMCHLSKNTHCRVLPTQGHHSICQSATASYSRCTKSRNTQSCLQPSNSPLLNSFDKINENEVECKSDRHSSYITHPQWLWPVMWEQGLRANIQIFIFTVPRKDWIVVIPMIYDCCCYLRIYIIVWGFGYCNIMIRHNFCIFLDIKTAKLCYFLNLSERSLCSHTCLHPLPSLNPYSGWLFIKNILSMCKYQVISSKIFSSCCLVGGFSGELL